MNGQTCVRGARIMVKRVIYVLAECRNREEIDHDFPRLDDEDIQQALLYAAGSVDDR